LPAVTVRATSASNGSPQLTAVLSTSVNRCWRRHESGHRASCYTTIHMYCYSAILLNTSLYCYLDILHCVSKNDTDVAHYNFNAHQPILVIFGRDAAERICYRTVIW